MLWFYSAGKSDPEPSGVCLRCDYAVFREGMKGFPGICNRWSEGERMLLVDSNRQACEFFKCEKWREQRAEVRKEIEKRLKDCSYPPSLISCLEDNIGWFAPVARPARKESKKNRDLK